MYLFLRQNYEQPNCYHEPVCTSYSLSFPLSHHSSFFIFHSPIPLTLNTHTQNSLTPPPSACKPVSYEASSTSLPFFSKPNFPTIKPHIAAIFCDISFHILILAGTSFPALIPLIVASLPSVGTSSFQGMVLYSAIIAPFQGATGL